MMDEYKEEILEVCGMECSSNQPFVLTQVCYMLHTFLLSTTHT